VANCCRSTLTCTALPSSSAEESSSRQHSPPLHYPAASKSLEHTAAACKASPALNGQLLQQHAHLHSAAAPGTLVLLAKHTHHVRDTRWASAQSAPSGQQPQQHAHLHCTAVQQRRGVQQPRQHSNPSHHPAGLDHTASSRRLQLAIHMHTVYHQHFVVDCHSSMLTCTALPSSSATAQQEDISLTTHRYHTRFHTVSAMHACSPALHCRPAAQRSPAAAACCGTCLPYTILLLLTTVLPVRLAKHTHCASPALSGQPPQAGPVRNQHSVVNCHSNMLTCTALPSSSAESSSRRYLPPLHHQNPAALNHTASSRRLRLAKHTH
jgi:hypothetical protein